MGTIPFSYGEVGPTLEDVTHILGVRSEGKPLLCEPPTTGRFSDDVESSSVGHKATREAGGTTMERGRRPRVGASVEGGPSEELFKGIVDDVIPLAMICPGTNEGVPGLEVTPPI
ncbi:hypothetical protein AMTR_s00091p00130770 [Amborella trichopoda]|uniref:Uncharacterized protein n=1 Tax=Amborella trichopoda TaxID=13333 RepID=W1P0Z4_AMBTC|nr:hypothetical protein AMTR_s00091p00130770 [Amborella trichopoda]